MKKCICWCLSIIELLRYLKSVNLLVLVKSKDIFNCIVRDRGCLYIFNYSGHKGTPMSHFKVTMPRATSREQHEPKKPLWRTVKLHRIGFIISWMRSIDTDLLFQTYDMTIKGRKCWRPQIWYPTCRHCVKYGAVTIHTLRA